MNAKFFYGLVFLAVLIVACATTNRQAAAPTSDAEFKKGLDYSLWLYKEPIDILKEEPLTIPLPTQPDSTGAAVFAKTAIPPPSDSGSFSVQVASFYSEDNARAFLKTVQTQFADYNLQMRYSTGLWRVIAGYYRNHHDAEIVREQLRALRFPDAWIVQF